MWSPTLLLGLLSAVDVLVHSKSIYTRDGVMSGSNTTALPGRFIVEFTEGANAATEATALAHSGLKVLKVFDSDVFSGASIESHVENIDTLQSIDSINKAWQSKKIKMSLPVLGYSDDAGTPFYSVHAMTGVDKLHAAGITGKGVQVAIVDTGVDYNHPALGGGFGPGFKVAGGWDFAGDGSWPESGEREPDSDPMDENGHGTHISGILAVNGTHFKGVAPDATIFIYKVFTASDYTDEDVLIEGFLRAYADGADVITCSVGADDGWASDPWAILASRMVEQGVVVTIAAGNDGARGLFKSSIGATGEYVISVASIEAEVVAAVSFKANFHLNGFTNSSRVLYTSNYMFDEYVNATLPIVPLYMNSSVPNQACTAAGLVGETRNFTNSILLVHRGGCNLGTQQANLASYGARYIMFYNADNTSIATPLGSFQYGITGMIEAAAGKAIINTILDGGNVTATFDTGYDDIMVSLPNPEGEIVSYYTSMGPTNDFHIKPDVAAPGGSIFSTYLDDGWATLSGTSMATPYIAGIAALYIGQHGGRKVHGSDFAKNLAMRIISSGKSMNFDDGQQAGNVYDGFLAPVAQIGTGLVNASKVLNYATSLSYSKFNLNDTHHFERYHSVDITNNGTTAITYTFAIEDSASLEAMNTNKTVPAVIGAVPRTSESRTMMIHPEKVVPQVSFPGGTFKVNPGETKTAKFSFTMPAGLDPAKVPVYGGKIIITGSNSESLSIPYLGVGCDVHNDVGSIFPEAYQVPSLYNRYHRQFVHPVYNATFNMNHSVMDMPILQANIQFQTVEMRWDIFESTFEERDWVYPPVPGQNGYIGSATYYPLSDNQKYFTPISEGGTDDRNNFVPFPQTYLYRTPFDDYNTEVWWLGILANGSQIAPGNYQMRIAGLMPFADPTHANSWDVLPFRNFEVLPLV